MSLYLKTFKAGEAPTSAGRLFRSTGPALLKVLYGDFNKTDISSLRSSSIRHVVSCRARGKPSSVLDLIITNLSRLYTSSKQAATCGEIRSLECPLQTRHTKTAQANLAANCLSPSERLLSPHIWSLDHSMRLKTGPLSFHQLRRRLTPSTRYWDNKHHHSTHTSTAAMTSHG